MAAGRCAGCGRTDSLIKVGRHIVDCPEYVQLYQSQPEHCLSPAAEYQRYCVEDNSAVARANRRGTRLAARFAEINNHQARSSQRWQRPKDILE